MNRLLELSNLPAKYQTPVKIISVDEDRPSYIELAKIKDNIEDFINKGKNLYICSSTCGNAKTSWAVKLMIKYFDRMWPNSYDVTRGLYVHVPTLLLDIKNFGNIPNYVSRINEADVVIWDDIAFSKLTEYEHEQLLQFIDNRMASGLSNIYTSNITDANELANYVGNRLSSRIYSSSKVIEFKAGDWRVGGKLE
jgi:DNA replication protein DnaC